MENEINSQTLGEQLKQSRAALKLTIDDIADRTQIPAKYLYWLEKGQYDKLPALVYTQGFLAKYSKILNLEKDKLMESYLKEAEEFCGSSGGKNASCYVVLQKKKNKRFVITPRLLAVLLSILAAMGIFGYFGWQVYGLMRPPMIVLENPQNDLAVGQERQIIKGKIMGANILMLNDRLLNFNETTGEFDEAFDLSEGLNVIELKAQNMMGKETTVIRKIIYNK